MTREEARTIAAGIAYPDDMVSDIAAALIAAHNDALEEAAGQAEDIFDSGNHGAHAGEQAIRTAAAIRARKIT